MGIPGVEVDDIGIDRFGIKIEAVLQGCEDGLEVLRRTVGTCVGGISLYGDVAGRFLLISEAAHFDLAALRELLREILNMDSGSAIDVRWKFVGEKKWLLERSTAVRAD